MVTPKIRRIRIELAYDGTDFAGWQFQEGERTVQGELEQVLSRIQGNRPVRVRGAGRTDAGVHARGQVADCELTSRRGDDYLGNALRRMLPTAIRVISVCTVPSSFHARNGTVSKTYRYRLDRSRYGDPFLNRYALHIKRDLDVKRLQAALCRLPGKRDWSGFAGSKCEVADRVRTLTEASFVEGPHHEASFTFVADGFLTHMVRNIVGTVLDVERGRFPVEWIDRILTTGDRNLAGPTAPPQGLCLEHIDYGTCCKMAPAWVERSAITTRGDE
jgi:tRNA pseudouridine38-40 synthase